MINVSRVVLSRNFAQPGGFTVHRQIGKWVRGVWTAGAEQTIKLSGTVIVATPEDLEQVPEGDRVKGAMAFYSPQEIFTTNETGTSDQIDWNGERYRIYFVAPWKDFGYYKAIGARMSGV